MRYIVLCLLALLILSGCAHNRVYDVPLEAATPAQTAVAPQTDKKIALLIYPEFEMYVYEQAESNWLTTYRIPIGTYTSKVLNQELASVGNLSVSRTLQAVKPQTVDYILVPEFGKISYATPTIHALQDAQFSTELKMRVLDGERREVETIYITGTETGVFRNNTANLVQQSVLKAVTAAKAKLVELMSAAD